MAMVPATPNQMIPANGATMTETAAGRSLSVTAETNQAALAAQATAQVQARFVMADRRPRSWDDVRVKLLAECRRPGFAEVARYRKPVGDGIEGPSIRFAEACMRYAGNMSCDTIPISDTRVARTLTVVVTDYETNASYSGNVTIQKTVERKNAKGRVVLGERKNSYGDTVYIVEATEDELLNTQNAMVSKAARTLILRMIPGDIVEEGQTQCVETSKAADAKDPRAAQKRLTDAFASRGVMPSELERYLGHPLQAITANEGAELKAIFEAIKDGETTWPAVIEHKLGEKADKPSASAQTKNVADKVRARTASKGAPAAETPHDADGVLVEPTAERQPGED